MRVAAPVSERRPRRSGPHSTAARSPHPIGRVTVQDPIAFRTVPQIHGALREAIDRALREIDLELAARSDNPLVDAGTGRMISGGNFQAIPAGARSRERPARARPRRVGDRTTHLRAVRGAHHGPTGGDGRGCPGCSPIPRRRRSPRCRQLAAPATLGVTTLSGVEDHASLAPLALQLLERSAALIDELAAIEALHAVDLLGVTGCAADGCRNRTALRGVSTRPSHAGIPAADLVPCRRRIP